jgi:type I restriction enzyme R subunit
MPNLISESEVENHILGLFSNLGYEIKLGSLLYPDGSSKGMSNERENYLQVILKSRLFNSLKNINRDIKETELEEVLKKLTRDESQDLIVNNKDFHKYLTDGVDIETRDDAGRITGKKIWLLNPNDLENNDFLAVNQFTVVEKDKNRRLDIVTFIV